MFQHGSSKNFIISTFNYKSNPSHIFMEIEWNVCVYLPGLVTQVKLHYTAVLKRDQDAFLCNRLVVLSSWQLYVISLSKSSELTGTPRDHHYSYAQRKEFIFQFACLLGKSELSSIYFFILIWAFFFEYGHQHLATLEDISMPSLVTRVIPL